MKNPSLSTSWVLTGILASTCKPIPNQSPLEIATKQEEELYAALQATQKPMVVQAVRTSIEELPPKPLKNEIREHAYEEQLANGIMALPPNHPQIHDYIDGDGRRFEYDEEEFLVVIIRIDPKVKGSYQVYLTEDFEDSPRVTLLQNALKALNEAQKNQTQ